MTVIFTLLAQDLGLLLTKFAPLRAYTLNIIGSLAGIASFTLMSFLSLPSWVWFLIAAILIIPFLPAGRSFGINVILLLGLVAAIAASDYAYVNIWSPYYRINLVQADSAGKMHFVGPKRVGELSDNYFLLANGINHQKFTTLKNSGASYFLPYTAFDEKPVYQNALVIGAGGGNDVAVALEHGVQRVDAVEIDPRIVDLGRTYHPQRPYDDPRVSVYKDDARSFLEKQIQNMILLSLPSPTR